MALNPSSIVEGLASGVAVHHLTKEQDANDLLVEMNDSLIGIYRCIESLAKAEIKDIYKVVTLYKVGFGPAFMPNFEHHAYMRVLATVPTAMLVTSIIGSPFVLTIPAPTPPDLWLSLDLPDGTAYILDATATSNQMNVYIRYTNKAPA